MAAISGGTIVVTLEGRDTNLGQLLSKIESQMARGVVAARQYDTAMAQISPTTSRLESANLSYAQSLARAAVASGDFAGAQRILAGALQQVTPNTTAASNAVNQLQRTIDQASAAQTKQRSIFTNAAQGFNSLIGAYFAVTTAAKAFGAVIDQGNQLEKQQAILRGLSGDTATYEKNLSTARQQQEKFGGSLADNVEGVANFANLSRRTGVEIGKLTDLARGLATIDPAQGFKGAGIALKEFFSGDITSLARRFEIPRDALNGIKDIADQGDRLAALEQVLAKFGVTQELIAASANTTAVQYEKLTGAATDAIAAIGQALATGLEPAARKATTILQAVATGISSLENKGTGKLAIAASLIDASKNADDFNRRITDANIAIDASFAELNTNILSYIPGVNLFQASLAKTTAEGLKFKATSDAVFAFTKSLRESGVDALQLATVTDKLNGGFFQLETRMANLGNVTPQARQEMDTYEKTLLAVALTGEEGIGIAQAFAQEVANGGESSVSATARLQEYILGLAQSNELTRQRIAGEQDAAVAAKEHAAAIIAENQELTNNAFENVSTAAAADLLKQREEQLTAAALGSVGGLGASGNAAIDMAKQFNVAEGAAADLINMLRNLDIAKNLANAKTPSENNTVVANALAGRTINLDNLRQAQKSLDGVNDAMRDQAFQSANAAGKVKILNDELKKLSPGTEAYIRKQTEIAAAEDKSAKTRKKAGGAKLSDNEKIHNQLAAQEDKFQSKVEDAEQKHQDNLLKIVQDAAKKQLETQKENEVQKRRSRFDFYKSLNSSDIPPVDKQKFAQSYEEAFAEAQRIAQSGRAKLSQEFLALRKSQIQELQELAQDEAEIKSDKDLSKSDRQARLRDLEAERQLLLDAQEEEKKNLLEGGDKNQNDLQERISDENKAYADQLTQIVTNADRAADAKIAAAERAKKAVSNENKAYADQLSIIDQIISKNGGKPIGAVENATSSPVPSTTKPETPVTVTKPIPITTDVPLQVAAEVLTVKQLELFVVRDQGVIDTLGDQTARLEGKLNDVNASIGNLGTTLGGKIDGLKGALGKSNLVTK